MVNNEVMKTLLEKLAKYGVTNERELDEAIRNLQKLNITAFVSETVEGVA